MNYQLKVVLVLIAVVSMSHFALGMDQLVTSIFGGRNERRKGSLLKLQLQSTVKDIKEQFAIARGIDGIKGIRLISSGKVWKNHELVKDYILAGSPRTAIEKLEQVFAQGKILPSSHYSSGERSVPIVVFGLLEAEDGEACTLAYIIDC